MVTARGLALNLWDLLTSSIQMGFRLGFIITSFAGELNLTGVRRRRKQFGPSFEFHLFKKFWEKEGDEMCR